MGASDSELQVGEVFAGHRITGVAGRGGMGVVYRAEQLDLERPVALKLIATPLARDDDFRERFVRESRAAAAIDHPNVIPVYSAGEDEGRLYLAMRLVEGDDLRTLVRRTGPLSPARAAAVISQIAGALDAAHARGLVHRDIKPANVLLDGDHAYLTDFGLTKRLSGEATMTGSGRWVGTLGYIAPEQIRGEPVDARADVYALGCLLFYALTGAAPYRRDSDEATLYAHLHDPAPDARDLAPGVPGPLADVVVRALAKDPDERFPSAGDLGRVALAAVGVGPAPGPERTVARGAAAPGGAGDEETAVPGPATPTVPVARPAPRASPVRRFLAPGLSLLAGAGVVLATVALLGVGGDGSPSSGTSSTPATTTGGRVATGGVQVAEAVKVDPRPNDIAYGFGRVWTISPQTGRLTGLPATGDGPTRRIALPWRAGTSSVAAGFGSLWVVNGSQHRLVRIDPATGKVKADKILPAGNAVTVATGSGAVWVGRRAPDAVLKIAPSTGAVLEVPFGDEGVRDLTTGGGYVWVTNRYRNRVTRLDPATGARISASTGSILPRGVAYSGGTVWVTNFTDGILTRFASVDLRVHARHLVGNQPVGVAATPAAVWVANVLDDTVSRVDPATGRQVGQAIQVGANPSAIVAHGRSAWAANLGDGTVTRVDLR